jgi:beta-glucosidase
MLNGTHACENRFLLTDVLRKEWGWKGCTLGDYYGTHSCVKSIRAGLDVELPYVFGRTLLHDAAGAQLTPALAFTIQ